jgi:hypothetical protein
LCYQAGVPTGNDTINLAGLSASQLRYYDFAGNLVVGSPASFKSGKITSGGGIR